MCKQFVFIFILLICINNKALLQNFSVSPAQLSFNNNQLIVLYDITSSHRSDRFFIWLEINNSSGDLINAKSLTGDIGNVKMGYNKTIVWNLSKDSILIDDMVTVEIMAEKYEELYNKRNLILLSSLLPGLGQAKATGKPIWLTGFIFYGALAGAIVLHSDYTKSYQNYQKSMDAVQRNNYYNLAQNQKDLSGILFVSAATVWVSNMIWMMATPSKYKPLKHVSFSINRTPDSIEMMPMIALRFNFD